MNCSYLKIKDIRLRNPQPIELPVVDVDDLRFAHLSTAQGLSQTRVQQIVQDDQGFLWFGTQYGLNRYDGYTFKVFAHDSARTNSLSGVYIFSLFKDRAGYLWVASDEALDRFDPRTETFVHYRLHRVGAEEGDATVILPPWWKSWWFTAALGALLLLLAWAIYQRRLRQIARQFDIRLEERVNERTRIARELHDSLLQGFQGLMFRLQAVRELLPHRLVEAVEHLDGALEQGDEAIVEGREAVQGLRASAAVGTGLESSLKALGEELTAHSGEGPASYQVLVHAKDLGAKDRTHAVSLGLKRGIITL